MIHLCPHDGACYYDAGVCDGTLCEEDRRREQQRDEWLEEIEQEELAYVDQDDPTRSGRSLPPQQ